MADNDNITDALLSPILPADDLADLKAIAEENANEIESGELDPLHALGMRGLGMDADAIEGAIDIGAQMLRQGMNDQAFKYFMGMVQLEPTNWRVYQLLGLSQHRQKHYPAAEQLYTMALALAPGEALTTLYLGECEFMLNKVESGLAKVKQALAELQKSPENKAYCKRAEQILAMQAGAVTQEAPKAGK